MLQHTDIIYVKENTPLHFLEVVTDNYRGYDRKAHLLNRTSESSEM